MAKIYKRYDRIFKERAVGLIDEKNTLQAAADELGIRSSMLCRWRKEYQKFGKGSFPGIGYDRYHPDDQKVFNLKKKLNEAALRYEILKKASPYLYQGNLMIYEFIRENERSYSILKMCSILEVGYGRYHRWKKNGISLKQQRTALFKEDLKSIFFLFKKD